MKKELSLELNNYLSNLGVMYIKLHNLHWNVCGLNFKSVHEYIETLYNAIAEDFDEVAEMIKIQEEIPFASMGEYIQNSTIEEIKSKEYLVNDVNGIILEDFKILKKHAESIRNISLIDDDFEITNMLENHLEQYNKNLWFLSSMKK